MATNTYLGYPNEFAAEPMPTAEMMALCKKHTMYTWAAGDQVKCSMFQEKDFVDVVGTSKGKGFQGVMKRHGFKGGRATHGSMFHRAPGSIGGSSFPSRVYPGMKGTGRMGGKRITTKNLLVIKVDEEKNLIYLRGSVPGGENGYVALKRAKRG